MGIDANCTVIGGPSAGGNCPGSTELTRKQARARCRRHTRARREASKKRTYFPPERDTTAILPVAIGATRARTSRVNLRRRGAGITVRAAGVPVRARVCAGTVIGIAIVGVVVVRVVVVIGSRSCCRPGPVPIPAPSTAPVTLPSPGGGTIAAKIPGAQTAAIGSGRKASQAASADVDAAASKRRCLLCQDE